MEGGSGNFEDDLEDKVMEEISFFLYPILRMKYNMYFQICWNVRMCLEDPILKS